MGYRLFDTAEMYGEGGAEEVLGSALADALRSCELQRDEVVVVSKVYPQNASASGVAAACERSLKRLRLDTLDAYLLHWRGAVPLAETVAAFEELRQRGLIRCWGVSNFDIDDMRELSEVAGGAACATNQIYYSLTARGPGFELLPWQQARGIVTMAYSPIDQGALCRSKVLGQMGEELGVAPAQIALSWLTAQAGVIAIPKAAAPAHLRENFASPAMRLDAAHLARLDAAFPPPRRRTPLAMR